MTSELLVLTPVAASIAVAHTLAGPDHYLPFIAMARARGWGAWRTAWVTALCGLGHIASSVVLAALGGVALLRAERIAQIESLRGEIAAWGLIAFGLAYTAWGVRRALRSRRHDHRHAHDDGTVHEHGHDHHGVHLHAHGRPGSLTPWVLFTIFLFGPCEPLIPLLLVPAVRESGFGFAWIAAVFGAVTIATMLAAVAVALRGLQVFRTDRLERWTHALAGVTVLACGLGMVVLGL